MVTEPSNRAVTAAARSRALVAILAVSAGLMASGVGTGGPRQVEAVVRLYVFDCGLLIRSDANPIRYELTLEQVETPSFADPCFLIVHPEGTLLWEAGIIPDRLIEPGGTELPRGPEDPLDSNRAERILRSQLQEIGYRLSDVTYLAVSHRHSDHIANMNDYAGSTWLVQAAGRRAMFSESARRSPSFDSYSDLENSSTVLLNGDHDVFGDGSIVIKSTPGHTEGHQSLFVRLDNTGPVLLSGDLYHYRAERTLNTFPDFELNREQSAQSRAVIELFLEQTGARLWIHHDLGLFQSLRKSPAFYD